MHRFVHIGDTHLGPNARNADRLAALDEILVAEHAKPVSAWLWPGDLNHGRSTIEDRNALTTYVKAMGVIAPVLVVYGNHDLPGDLDFLAHLRTHYPVYVIARPQVVRVELATGGAAAIFCFPYPQRAGLVGAGVESSQIVEEAKRALEVIFMGAAAELKDAEAQGCVPLMIGHCNVAGSITSSGQPNIGKEIEVDPALLARFGPIYIGLNHIHKAQSLAGAHYAGSICRLDWGEIEPKRYLVIECFRHEHTRDCYDDPGPAHGSPFTVCGSIEGWKYDVTQRALDIAPMFHIEGELTRDGFTWRIIGNVEDYDPLQWSTPPDGPGQAPAAALDFAGCEVRVRFTYAAADKAVLDFELVKAPFAGAKRLVLEPIAVSNRALRAPEVARAHSFEEKVVAYVEQTGATWTPALDEKLSLLLQHHDPAAFLDVVTKRLSGAAASPSAPGGNSAAGPHVAPDTVASEVLL